MELYVSVTRHQIASALSDEEAISLIKVIDEEKADWDFTKQIADHYLALMKEYFEHPRDYEDYLKGFYHAD